MCVTACSNVTKVVRTTRVGMSRQVHANIVKKYSNIYPDFNDNTVFVNNTPKSIYHFTATVVLRKRRNTEFVEFSYVGRRTADGRSALDNYIGFVGYWIQMQISFPYGCNGAAIHESTQAPATYQCLPYYIGSAKWITNIQLIVSKSALTGRHIVCPPNTSNVYFINLSRLIPLAEHVYYTINYQDAPAKYFEFKVNGHKCFGELMGIY